MRQQEFVAKQDEQQRIIDGLNYELRYWEQPQTDAEAECSRTRGLRDDAQARVNRVDVCSWEVSPQTLDQADWVANNIGYWGKLGAFPFDSWTDNEYCPHDENTFNTYKAAWVWDQEATYTTLCGYIDMCVPCIEFEAYPYATLIRQHIIDWQAKLDTRIQEQTDANARLVSLKGAWDALQAEYDSLVPEVDPLLDEFDRLVTEAQVVAEEAVKCPYGITEYEDRLARAELLRDEWWVRLAPTWLEYIDQGISTKETALANANSAYSSIFNSFYNSNDWYETADWDRRRRLSVPDAESTDFSVAFSLSSTDRPAGIKMCVADDGKLSGFQMHYGTWDGEYSNSYLGTSKLGVVHGDLSTSCTDHSFQGNTIN